MKEKGNARLERVESDVMNHIVWGVNKKAPSLEFFKWWHLVYLQNSFY